MSFTPNRKRRIFLDMDGCIADFSNEFNRRFNVGPEDFANGEYIHGNDAFWKLFDSNPKNFFIDILPFEGTNAFVENVLALGEEYGYSVEILTALPKKSLYPAAEREKKEWMIAQMFSRHIPMNIGPYAEQKQNHYRPGDILIDDNVKNIDQWHAKGGSAILHEGDFTTSLIELDKILKAQYSGSAKTVYTR